MRKILLLFSLSMCSVMFSQYCGTTHAQEQAEQQYPEIKQRRDAFEAKLSSMDMKAYIQKISGTTSVNNGQYAGTIYEIPVVVHVIESSDASNASLKLTDAQIQTWIDNCNKMYATTYGNGYYAEGPGSLEGNVIPFKLVLAKRSPQCTPSTGIVRYNGSSLAGYDANGLRDSGTAGPNEGEVRTLAPHWPENAYYNIYLVIGFDGDKKTYGLMGYARYPESSDSVYETFMKVTTVTNANDSTLAHEFGHSLGLIHPFEGASGSPGPTPTTKDCPPNLDCTKDNDKVCDTEPTASLLSVYPTPNNSALNPCTLSNYNGVQYNIMNYTNSKRKFTAGQRDRALVRFMGLRGNLTNSLGGTDLAGNPPAVVAAPSCVPQATNNPDFNSAAGPIRVKLNSIDNPSTGYLSNDKIFYVDYAKQACISKVVMTDIPSNSSSTLQVTFEGNNQRTQVWMDYNNNGTFEASEQIGVSPYINSSFGSPATYSLAFTPPATAVLDTYLRMRVRTDLNFAPDACANCSYGQSEDYAVRINSVLGTNESKVSTKEMVVYNGNTNKILLISDNGNLKFGPYQVFDLSGKLIQSGTAEQEIQLKSEMPRGTYIINYQFQSKKFIK